MSSNTATTRVSSLDSSKQLLPWEQVRIGGDPSCAGGTGASPHQTTLRELAETSSHSLLAFGFVGPSPINIFLIISQKICLL